VPRIGHGAAGPSTTAVRHARRRPTRKRKPPPSPLLSVESSLDSCSRSAIWTQPLAGLHQSIAEAVALSRHALSLAPKPSDGHSPAASNRSTHAPSMASPSVAEVAGNRCHTITWQRSSVRGRRKYYFLWITKRVPGFRTKPVWPLQIVAVTGEPSYCLVPGSVAETVPETFTSTGWVDGQSGLSPTG
jgi:hypothetical protein